MRIPTPGALILLAWLCVVVGAWSVVSALS